MIDPKPKLIAALGNAQEYLDLAISAQDRGEREKVMTTLTSTGYARIFGLIIGQVDQQPLVPPDSGCAH
jgi:hypothetical protein